MDKRQPAFISTHRAVETVQVCDWEDTKNNPEERLDSCDFILKVISRGLLCQNKRHLRGMNYKKAHPGSSLISFPNQNVHRFERMLRIFTKTNLHKESNDTLYTQTISLLIEKIIGRLTNIVNNQ